jgi:hypothetical protein
MTIPKAPPMTTATMSATPLSTFVIDQVRGGFCARVFAVAVRR